MKIPGIQLFKSFGHYALVMFVNAGISFGVFSWLTHYLSPADFGTINLYSSFTILLLPFITFGIQFILSVDFFKMAPKEYSIQFINGLSVPVILMALFTAACFLALDGLNNLLKANRFFILAAPLSCFLIFLNDIAVSQMRNRGKHSLYARYSIFKTLLESFTAVLLVLILSLTWQARLGGSLVSLFVCGVFIYYLLKKWALIEKKPDLQSAFRLALSGAPFIPERLAIFFLSYSDRFFIDYFKGVQAVGLYGAGAQIGTIVNLITMALSYSFQPVIFKKMSQVPVDYNGLRSVILGYTGISLLLTCSLLLVIPVLFKYFIGSAFRDSSLYAVNLSIAGFFWAVYNAFLSCLLFLKKNREIMFIAISGTIVSVVLNFYNVSHFGAVGATYTNIVAYLFMAIVVIARVHHHYDIKKIFGAGPVVN